MGDKEVDDLAVVIDGSLDLAPGTSAFDVGLVHKPAATDCTAGWSYGIDE